jgi:CDP-glucose 4,6-dehydratase
VASILLVGLLAVRQPIRLAVARGDRKLFDRAIGSPGRFGRSRAPLDTATAERLKQGSYRGRIGILAISAEFWRGKRVLVTGHTGFKGAWLCHWLLRLGAQVTGIALAPEGTPNLFRSSRLAERMTSHETDIRDLAALRAQLRAAAPEIVLHLAAQSLVRRSYADPVGTFATNVIGTVNLLEAARETDSVRVFVNVTSDKCYRNLEWAWPYREIDALGGADPYSASKACAELVGAAYRSAFFAAGPNAQTGAPTIALASARAGNVIGGGDWSADRLLPDCVRAFSAAQPVELRNPQAVRPWQHVLEPLAGYLLLAARLARDPACADAWNFGPDDGDARPVAWVVEQAARHWGAAASWRAQPGDHPHEAGQLRVDSAKARALLGWRPRLTLDQALAWTVEWYRRERAGDDTAAVTNTQIAAYEALEDPGARAP